MRVVHVERCRFRVQSESNPKAWYLVDLLSNNRMGQCDCADFRTRIGPLHNKIEERQMRRDDAGIDFRWSCKHIDAAKDFFADMWLVICWRRDKEKFGTKH